MDNLSIYSIELDWPFYPEINYVTHAKKTKVDIVIAKEVAATDI